MICEYTRSNTTTVKQHQLTSDISRFASIRSCEWSWVQFPQRPIFCRLNVGGQTFGQGSIIFDDHRYPATTGINQQGLQSGLEVPTSCRDIGERWEGCTDIFDRIPDFQRWGRLTAKPRQHGVEFKAPSHPPLCHSFVLIRFRFGLDLVGFDRFGV
jgi:hypothetical protein